jgi:uncharacterized protein YkwD
MRNRRIATLAHERVAGKDGGRQVMPRFRRSGTEIPRGFHPVPLRKTLTRPILFSGEEPVMRTRSKGTKLVILSLAVFGLAAMAFLTGCSQEVQAELYTYQGINAIRAKNGLPPLQPDAQLVEVARIRSRDMAQKNYFSHTPPDGCNFVCLMDSRGYPKAWAGENIAWNNWDWANTAKRAVTMWENSPPHLENILNCHYTRVGTGVAVSRDGRIYYTMLFEGANKC